jgi:hypothetical protein
MKVPKDVRDADVQLNLLPLQVIFGCTNSVCTFLNFDVEVAAYPDQLSESCTGFDFPASVPTACIGSDCGTWAPLWPNAVPDVAIRAIAATAAPAIAFTDRCDIPLLLWQ